MPSDGMEILHQLSDAEPCNEEGSHPSTNHQLDPGPTSRIKLFLLLGWIFGPQSNCEPSRWSREDNIHMPFLHIRLQTLAFGQGNALATFQRCMMAIFSDFLGDSLEVFMEDFSIFGNDFDSSLADLTKILEIFVKKRLVLGWEKSHFMVREGVVLGHIVSGKGLEVDKAKIEVIQNLPLLASIWDLRSFLGYVSFYRRFIQNFVKVSKPLTTLLCKDKDFIINEEGKCAFVMLKQSLIEALILQSPNWDLPFEIMCDASDDAVGLVLGQWLEKKPTTIWYTSKTDGELFQNMNTRVPSEPIFLLIHELRNYPFIKWMKKTSLNNWMRV